MRYSSSYSRLARFDVSVIAGSCVTALADGPTDYPDRKNTVQVQFVSTGTPVTVTNEDLQRSSNPVICGASGRWEIMQFRDAALVSGTKYDLSHRGWCRKVGGKLENWRKLRIVKHSERRCAAAERSLRHETSYGIDVGQSIFR